MKKPYINDKSKIPSVHVQVRQEDKSNLNKHHQNEIFVNLYY